MQTIMIHLALLAYAAFGLFTQYGQSKGGWIIGSMIVLCYIGLALIHAVMYVENLLNKGNAK